MQDKYCKISDHIYSLLWIMNLGTFAANMHKCIIFPFNKRFFLPPPIPINLVCQTPTVGSFIIFPS